MSALVFEPVERGHRQLVLRYRVDELRFSTSYWYDTVDFDELTERFGDDVMRWVEFHLLAFEANKAASLAPDVIDVGPVRRPRHRRVLGAVGDHLPQRLGGVALRERPPRLPAQPARGGRADERPGRATVDTGRHRDADVVRRRQGQPGQHDAARRRRRRRSGGVDFDAFVYSHSTYGRGSHQHDLIDGLLAHTGQRRLHRGWVLDDAIDSPAAQVRA